MAYDERLAERVRKSLARRSGISEKKMFGGLCFLANGHMCCGVVGEDLVVRVGPKAYEASLKKTGARPMDFTGRPLQGLVYVGKRGCGSEQALREWVLRGLEHARSLPPK
jgi:TfoX/Sxy family transcriptional regulator of competence genes